MGCERDNPDLRHLIEACTHLADQQERWAEAHFYGEDAKGNKLMPDAQHLAAEGPFPWRGIMSPAVLNIIHILEEMNLYEAPELSR